MALSDPPGKTKKPEELTVQQVARQFGVSDGVVYYWVEHGVLRARRLNEGLPYWITLNAADDCRYSRLTQLFGRLLHER
jgi:excisionase family DNA binding protein